MAFPNTGTLDTFNRANGALGSNWGVLGGYAKPFTIVSNAAKVNTVAFSEGGSYWSAATFSGTIEVWGTVGALPGDALSTFGVELISGSPGGSRNGYLFEVSERSGSVMPTGRVWRVDGNSYTQLGADISINLSAGQTIGMRKEGSTLRVYVNGSEVANRSDSTYSGTFYFGMYDYNLIANETTTFDTFGGGIDAGVTVTPAVATFKGGSIAPLVIHGGITITPNVITFKGAGIDPVVVYGAVQITPSPITYAAVTIGPDVITGGVEITPGVITFAVVAIDPTVLMPGEVPDLGDGDTPGFILFMVASAVYQELTLAGLAAGLEEPDETNAATWGDYLFG